MLTYVAAFATAITIAVTPVIGGAHKTAQAKKRQTEWTRPGKIGRAPIVVERPIAVSPGRGLYVLSRLEQDALRRTLFRSVRLVHSGVKA